MRLRGEKGGVLVDDTSELLIMRAPKLRKRLERLLEQIQADPSLRQWYVNDPARVIMGKIFPEVAAVVTSTEINRGNRLLYALLTNSEFKSWAATYEEDLLRRARDATTIEDPRRALETYLAIADRATIHADLARAVARYADAELIAGLTWKPTYRNGGPDSILVEIQIAVYAIGVLAVFAIGVGAVFVGAPETGGAFTRVDLATVANELAAAVQDRAAELRREGKLLDYGQRDIGPTG
jgi:hypothetical protein